MSQDKGKFLRVNVAADRLGLTDRRVRQLIQEGKLPHERESPRRTRVPETALEAYRQEHE